MNDRLCPAHSVITKLGGFEKVAAVTGAHVSRVYRWTYSQDKGGTGGAIPQRHWRPLLDYARAHDISLSADDFLIRSEVA